MAVAWMFGLLLAAACAGRSRPAAVDPHVDEVWRENVRIVQKIIRGKWFNGSEYLAAIEFFEDLTGLEARDNKSFVGRLPNENLESDLNRWQEWYVHNGSQLRWDPTTKKVVGTGV